jgi:hypothetical protein
VTISSKSNLLHTSCLVTFLHSHLFNVNYTAIENMARADYTTSSKMKVEREHCGHVSCHLMCTSDKPHLNFSFSKTQADIVIVEVLSKKTSHRGTAEICQSSRTVVTKRSSNLLDCWTMGGSHALTSRPNCDDLSAFHL